MPIFSYVLTQKLERFLLTALEGKHIIKAVKNIQSLESFLAYLGGGKSDIVFISRFMARIRGKNLYKSFLFFEVISSPAGNAPKAVFIRLVGEVTGEKSGKKIVQPEKAAGKLKSSCIS